MKKMLFGLAGLVLIAVLALPFLGAYKTEQAFNNWIAQVNQTGSYDLSWERYDKGWLQTHAVLKIGFKPQVILAPLPQDGEKAWYLPVNVKLNHGPVLWLDGLKLGWFSGEFFLDQQHSMWTDRKLEAEGEGHFFVSEINMNLAGETTLKDRGLPFTLTAQAGETFQLGAYSGSGVIGRDGRITYQGILPSFSVSGSDYADVSADRISFRMDSNFGGKVGEYVVPGSGEFAIEKIAVKSTDDRTFDLQKLLLSSDVQINEQQSAADIKLKVAFAGMDVLGEKVTDAVLDLGFADISVLFLDQYLRMLQSQYEGEGSEPFSAMQAMGMASEHLLPAGPEMHLDSLAFTTREGSLTFEGHVAVAPEAAKQMGNPIAMLSYLTADASLLVDKPLAFRLVRQSTMKDLNAAQFEGGNQMTDDEKEALADNQTHMKLDMLTVQGMLMDKGERYSSEFHFKDGKAELNGQPLPLPF